MQSGVFDVIKAVYDAVYDELDRMLSEVRETGQWPARQWESPTATGWSEAVLRLELSRARVFDNELRSLAENLRTVAGDSAWAGNIDAAKQVSQRLEPLRSQFQEAGARVFPSLY